MAGLIKNFILSHSVLIQKLKEKLSSRFIQNAGWLGAAELVNRVSRLGVTVVIARLLSPHDYGLVAIVLTTNEFSNVFTLRGGIGSKLVQAPSEDLEILCDTAYWMNWILCILIFFIQCIAAFLISWFYDSNQLIWPICFMALSYLVLPTFAVPIALIYRENQIKIPAICNAVQAVLSNLLTVIFALLGLGIWAIVLPIVLTLPVWVFIARRSHTWRSRKPFTFYRWKEIADFSLNNMGVELLNKLRANLDYLLVGNFLGLEALGIYYFAFNAGLGISLNVLQSLTWSLFPHLCDSRGNLEELKERYFRAVKTIALIIVPLVVLQSGLAPLYVPIVFGQKWINAVPILMLICLSALPRPFGDAASALLNSIDRSRTVLGWNIIFTLIFTFSLLLSVKMGIFWVAASVLLSHLIGMPAFAVWATQSVFSAKNTSLSKAR
jgi:PST family polysaccharide transporter